MGKGNRSILFVTKETEGILKSSMLEFIDKAGYHEYYDIHCEVNSKDADYEAFRLKVIELLGLNRSLKVHIFPFNRDFVSRPLEIILYPDEVFISEKTI